MKIYSTAFEYNKKIPEIYTCKGKNINPPLTILEIPDWTKSLALIMDDPDAPNWTRDHRIMRNIPPVWFIEESSIPDWAIQWKNSRWDNKYGWPCPPFWIHRYFFKVYALTDTLNIPSDSDKKKLEESIANKILEKSELIWLFSK